MAAVVEAVSIAASAAAGGDSQIAIDIPAGSVQGEILLVHAFQHHGFVSLPTVSVSDGPWNDIFGENLGTDTNFNAETTGRAFWKEIGASEPSQFDLNFTGQTGHIHAIMYRISGVDAASPIGAQVKHAIESPVFESTAPALTTTVDDALVIAGFQQDENATAVNGATSSVDSPYTKHVFDDIEGTPKSPPNVAALAGASAVFATSGSNSATAGSLVQWNPDNGNETFGFSVELKPGAGDDHIVAVDDVAFDFTASGPTSEPSLSVTRFDTTFTNDGDTLDVSSAGVSDLAQAFARLSGSQHSGIDNQTPTSTGNVNHNESEFGVELTAADSATFRVNSGTFEKFGAVEVWECNPNAGDKSTTLIAKGVATLGNGTGSVDVALSGVTDINDLVAIRCGWENTQGNVNQFDEVNCTLEIVDSGGPQLRITRGGSAGTLEVYYAVVEFIGADWSVQQLIETTTGTKTFPTALGATNQAFLISTYHAGSGNVGLDDVGWCTHIGSTTQFELATRAAGVLGRFVGYVVEDTAGDMLVQHSPQFSDVDGDGSTSNTNEHTMDWTVPTAVQHFAKTSVLMTAHGAGGGTAHPRSFWSATLTSNANFQARRKRFGQPAEWSAQVIEWPLVTSGAPPVETTVEPNDAVFDFLIDNATVNQVHVVGVDDASFAAAFDNATVNQDHKLTPALSLFDVFAGNATVKQDHRLTPNVSSFDAFADNANVAQDHKLTPNLALFDFFADAATIAQDHKLTPNAVAFGFVIDQASVGQVHDVFVDDASFVVEVDNTLVVITGVSVAPDDVAFAVAVENTSVAQVHIVASDDALFGLVADNVSVNQLHLVQLDDATFAVVADNLTVNQDHKLSAQAATFAVEADNTSVTQLHFVATESVEFALSIDQATVNQGQVIVVDDAVFAVEADNAGTVQDHKLTASSVAFDWFADNATILAQGFLTPDDLTFGVDFDVASVSQVHDLAPDDQAFGTFADNANVNQDHKLTPIDASFAVAAGIVTVNQVHLVGVDGAAFAFEADNTAVNQDHKLTPADTAFATLVGNVGTAQTHIVGVDDATFDMFADAGAVTQNHDLLVSDITFGLILDIAEILQFDVALLSRNALRVARGNRSQPVDGTGRDERVAGRTTAQVSAFNRLVRVLTGNRTTKP